MSNSGAVPATSIADGLGLAAPYDYVGGAYPGTGGDCTATLNAGLLVFALRKRVVRLDWGPLRSQLFSTLGILLMAGVVSWFAVEWWTSNIGHANKAACLGEVFVPAILASVVYFGLALLMRIHAAQEIFRLVFRR